MGENDEMVKHEYAIPNKYIFNFPPTTDKHYGVVRLLAVGSS